jgi:hypothetical protein
MSDKTLYKVIFLNTGKVYELFAEGVTTSGLWGFLEVTGLVFETGEGLVVDPTEEKMRQEFEGARVVPDSRPRIGGESHAVSPFSARPRPQLISIRLCAVPARRFHAARSQPVIRPA